MENVWRKPEREKAQQIQATIRIAVVAGKPDNCAMKLRWDGWELDIPARQIVGDDGPVHVEPQVFDVLVYLATNRDRVVSKEELLDEVWGDQFVSESALTSRIKSIRQALGDDGRTQKYVRNVHGRGYQFVGQIQSRPDAAQEESAPMGIAQSVALDDEFPFVGRESEINEAMKILDGRKAGLVFIGGAPGVGKTRLAVELMERSRHRGTRLAAARCEENLASTLQSLREIMGQLAAAYPEDFQSWASGLESQLLAIAPGLVRSLEGSPMPVDTYAMFEVLTTVLERASVRHSLILLIDDLHWSDQPTRVFLSRLVRILGNRPITFICTFRSTTSDLSPDTAAWIGIHSRLPASIEISLGRLDEEAALGLVNAVLGDDVTQSNEILAQTEGHGLFLTETLRDFQLGGTSASSIPKIVASRFNSLSTDAQLLVRTGAVLGSDFAFRTVMAASGLSEEDALEAIDAALAADLLHVGAAAERLRFSHQMIPQVVIESTSPLTLAMVHRQCGDALEAEGAGEIRLAYHALKAIPLVPAERAVKRSRDAALRAVEANNYDAAIHLLAATLAVVEEPRIRAELLLEIGNADNAAGRAVAGAGYFEQAARLASENGWTDILVEAAMGHFGRSPYRRPRSNTTLELLEVASRAVGDEAGLAKARLMAKTAAFSKFVMALTEGDEMTRLALDMAGEVEPRQRIELLELRAVVLACPAGVDKLGEVDTELEPLRSAHGVYAADASVPETRLMMLAEGDAMRAAARPDAVRVKAQPIAEWRDLSLRSTFAAWNGDIDDAHRLCEDAAATGDTFWGDSARYVYALAHLFLAQLDGEWERPVELFESLRDNDLSQVVLLATAWANLAAGNDARGRELAASVNLAALPRLAEQILGGNALIAAAEVALLLDDETLKSAAESALLPVADLMLGVPWASSLAAADSLARLAARRGDEASAERYAATARDVYTRLQAPVLLERIGS